MFTQGVPGSDDAVVKGEVSPPLRTSEIVPGVYYGYFHVEGDSLEFFFYQGDKGVTMFCFFSSGGRGVSVFFFFFSFFIGRRVGEGGSVEVKAQRVFSSVGQCGHLYTGLIFHSGALPRHRLA